MKFKKIISFFFLSFIFSNILFSQVIIGQRVQIFNDMPKHYLHLWLYENEDEGSFLKYIILNPRGRGDNVSVLGRLTPQSRIAYYSSSEKKEIQTPSVIKYVPLSKVFENQIPNSTSIIRAYKGFFGHTEFATTYVIPSLSFKED